MSSSHAMNSAPNNPTAVAVDSSTQSKRDTATTLQRSRKKGIDITIKDVKLAERHFMSMHKQGYLAELPLTTAPPLLHVLRLTKDTVVSYLVDHIHLFELDRVVTLTPLDTTGRTFHVRHDKRLCFWIQPHRHSDESERFGHIFDQSGCVDKSLMGAVLKCHCELPSASVRHLALHHETCTVDPITATDPSLKAWYMHSFGINHD